MKHGVAVTVAILAAQAIEIFGSPTQTLTGHELLINWSETPILTGDVQL